MRLRKTGTALGFAVAGMLFMAARADARVCQGNSEISGPYGFTAARFGLVGSPIAFTASFTGTAVPSGGTATGTSASSVPDAAMTGPGGLVTGAAAGEPFSRTGSLFADGDGNLFLNNAGGAQFQFGTYTVNADCTVAMSLNNNFAFGSTGASTGAGTGGAGGMQANALAGPSTVNFTGVLVARGEEIDVVQSGAPGGTSMTLKRTVTFRTCGNDDLDGEFGIASAGNTISMGGTGTFGVTVSGPVFTPFALTGRLLADGNGNFSTDAFSLLAPQQQQFSGTYTVNQDCTGTARLTAGDGSARSFDFVLVREFGRPGLQMYFNLRGSGITGSGVAKPQ